MVLRDILLNAAVSENRKSYSDKDGPRSDEVLDVVAKQVKLGRWSF